MKISELIKHTQEILDKDGDGDVDVLYESIDDGTQYQGSLTNIATDGRG